KLREKKLVASRMHVAIQTSRHGDFVLQSGYGGVTLSEPTASTRILLKEALSQAKALFRKGVPYKKAGIVLSGLMPETYVTKDLFTPAVTGEKEKEIDRITDALNERFGHGAIHAAVIGINPTRASAKLRSQDYTTRWK